MSEDSAENRPLAALPHADEVKGAGGSEIVTITAVHVVGAVDGWLDPGCEESCTWCQVTYRVRLDDGGTIAIVVSRDEDTDLIDLGKRLVAQSARVRIRGVYRVDVCASHTGPIHAIFVAAGFDVEGVVES